MVIVPPEIACTIPQERIFGRSMRFVRTNKSKEEEELIAKSLVNPGVILPF